MKTSYSDPIGWVLSQIVQLSELTKIFYENNITTMSIDDYAEIQRCLSEAETAIKVLKPESDITTFNSSMIFSPYFHATSDKNFEEYFNHCLNPDNAHIGFLEELDVLIAIARNRKVIIAVGDTVVERKAAEVLEHYLAQITPF